MRRCADLTLCVNYQHLASPRGYSSCCYHRVMARHLIATACSYGLAAGKPHKMRSSKTRASLATGRKWRKQEFLSGSEDVQPRSGRVEVDVSDAVRHD